MRSPCAKASGHRHWSDVLALFAGCVSAWLWIGAASAGTLVVVNKAGDDVSLVDTETGELVATIPTGKKPHEVALSPDGRWALVTNHGRKRDPDWTMTLIDVENARAEATIDLAPHTRPHGVVWHPDGRRALVTTEGSESLLIVDVFAGEISMELATQAAGAHMVAIDPSGARAYVANTESGSVTLFDLQRQERLAVTVTGVGAEGIAVHPDGKQVWVANRGANTISVLDAETLNVLTTLRAERAPIRIAFTPDGSRALVTNAISSSVRVFDTRTMETVIDFSTRLGFSLRDGRFLGGLFGLMPLPVALQVAEDGESVYVSNTFAGRIGRFRLSDGERIEVFEAGDRPDGLAYTDRAATPDVALDSRRP